MTITLTYGVQPQPQFGHALGRRDLQLDLVLVLGQVDLRGHLAALQVDLQKATRVNVVILEKKLAKLAAVPTQNTFSNLTMYINK
jgi:hypothetical protein